eukprot:6385569-Ditylum_brightwellii.AAC.1
MILEKNADETTCNSEHDEEHKKSMSKCRTNEEDQKKSNNVWSSLTNMASQNKKQQPNGMTPLNITVVALRKGVSARLKRTSGQMHGTIMKNDMDS